MREHYDIIPDSGTSELFEAVTIDPGSDRHLITELRFAKMQIYSMIVFGKLRHKSDRFSHDCQVPAEFLLYFENDVAYNLSIRL